jgi:hypothetical protein
MGENAMNELARFRETIGRYSVVDVLLADVAVRIQLSPTEYDAASKHYDTMAEWIKRPESPLYGRVQNFYPQGGFSTGSTVSSHSDRSEFDLDAMADINWPTNIDPEIALATLHKAIAAELGSRYYSKSTRMTRCTQVQYDGMHLDVTPSIWAVAAISRKSIIFHSKPSDPSVPKQSLWANPWGLADWFNRRAIPDDAFGAYFEQRSLNYDRSIRADTTDVPSQAPTYRKSRDVICLQLIKRWRNIAYEKRHNSRRMPPSVLLTYYVGLNAAGAQSLIDALIHHVSYIVAILQIARDQPTGLVHAAGCDDGSAGLGDGVASAFSKLADVSPFLIILMLDVPVEA